MVNPEYTFKAKIHASLLALSKPFTDACRHRPRTVLAAGSHRCSDATIVSATVDALKCGSCLEVV
ncbi:MAG: hypothetical protein VX115_01170, partial [Candidatus Thermoplasmatota archaeon]|nr:hypothetical protein [Candidatus Thermoplasmatota archaeon]